MDVNRGERGSIMLPDHMRDGAHWQKRDTNKQTKHDRVECVGGGGLGNVVTTLETPIPETRLIGPLGNILILSSRRNITAY